MTLMDGRPTSLWVHNGRQYTFFSGSLDEVRQLAAELQTLINAVEGELPPSPQPQPLSMWQQLRIWWSK